MFFRKITVLSKRNTARGLLRGVLLLAALSAPVRLLADPLLTPTDSFTAADGIRTYMDIGGVWNGTIDISPNNGGGGTNGDLFTATLSNALAGAENADAVSLTITFPTDLVYAGTSSVSTAGAGCVATPALAVNSATPSQLVFTLDGGAFTLPFDCAITVNYELYADIGANTGAHSIDSQWDYLDGGDAEADQENLNQNVDVRQGDVIVVKTATPNPPDGYADGDTAAWAVQVVGTGLGGSFDVVMTDTTANATAGTSPTSPLGAPVVTPPVSPPGSVTGPGQYTFRYIESGEVVNVGVQALVAVPSDADACPDLRNDVDVIDRLGNTSASFDSVQYDLQDPLLDYTPPNFNISVGTPTTVSFPVSNPGLAGGGIAKNISLVVTGLNGITINNLSAEWAFDGTDTFTYLGPDTVPSSGDEVLANGASSTLQFDASVSVCGVTGASNLTWTPSYQNACGLSFVPPIRNSSYTVINDPTLGVTKTATPTATNFGQPVTYDITLTGTNIVGLPATDAIDNNNDWQVTDTLPAGVSAGTITTIPAGTQVTVNGGGAITVGPINGLTAGDILVWSGDQQDLTPLPTISIDFTSTSAGVCPPATPPVTITNNVALDYIEATCPFTVNDAAGFVANDSPIDTATQQFTVGAGTPFETGRPDSTSGVAADEVNEGEHITFTATYDFTAPYGGIWAGSTFEADMGVSSLPSSAGGDVLRLVEGPSGTEAAVTVQVFDISGAPVQVFNRNLLLAEITGGDGTNVMQIPDLGFIGAAIADANMEDYRLIVSYTVTAPEGDLDAAATGLPLDESNIGTFTERVTITVVGVAGSCNAIPNAFVQGTTVDLARADPTIGATINGGNDFDVCGPVNAVVDITAPPAGDLSADNIRILLDGTNYTLPNLAGDFTFGGAGNLNALTKNFNFAGGNVEITVTPDTDNLTGDSTITFPVQLLNTANRDLSGTIFFDSNHTSPDLGAGENDEDYSNTFLISPPQPAANLDIEFFPPNLILADTPVYIWRVKVTNIGSNTVNGAVFTNEVPPGFTARNDLTLPAADSVVGQLMTWDVSFPALVPGGAFEVDIAIELPRGAGCNAGTPNLATVYFGCDTGTQLIQDSGPNVIFPVVDLQITHDSTNSFCELCDEATIELIIKNSSAVHVYDLTITENLDPLGLGDSPFRYVNNSTEVSVDGGTTFTPIAGNPTISGGGTVLTWDFNTVGLTTILDEVFSDLDANPPADPSEVIIRYRLSTNGEELVLGPNNDRTIEATADFELFCGDPGIAPPSEQFVVPLRQPDPQITKLGRNFSARQTSADYADPVFGGTDDIVVWRLDIANSGSVNSADLEDLLVNDTIGGNFTMQLACPTEASADLAATALETAGVPPLECVATAALSNTIDIDDPFGNPAADEPGSSVDVSRGSSGFIFFVGTILNQCTNQNNDADFEWGCEVDSPPAGGIDAVAAGFAAGNDDDSAFMSVAVDPAGINVTQTFTGTNVAQPVGTKGILTITVANNSGGTIRDLTLENIFPADYQLDPTSLVQIGFGLVVTPAFNTYPGIVDTLTHTNSAAPDGFTDPQFSFTSSTSGTVNQVNLLRNGDQITLTLGAIRITPFDDTADAEVRVETSGTATDPTYAATGNNQVTVSFDDTCPSNPAFADIVDNDTVNIDPEDMDVNINPSDPDLFFILADPAATLQLDVDLRNRGGHDATDFTLHVVVGNAMNVVSVNPFGGSCTLLTPAEELALTLPPPVWDPTTADVYRCVDRDPLIPNGADLFRFIVERDLADVTGDLTFRADVVGETTQFDGNTTTLGAAAPGFPNYSLDTVLARIIGFSMSKTLQSCNEPDSVDPAALIGEECIVRIQAQWFGFATPGFGSIEVRNVSIFDGAPGIISPPQPVNGQGTIGNPDTSASTAGITVGVQTPANPVTDLTETGFQWDLATIFTNTGSVSETFVADVTFRTLNDALNTSAAPNVHAAIITDEANARFDVFFPDTGATQSFDESSSGYPPQADRQASITITEPDLTITKEVCNESVNGGACAPGDFSAGPVLGDADDFFVFRITVENTDQTGGVTHAPAYDITITDALDPGTDQIAPIDFAIDGLDNDGDGLIDGADPDEGTINDLVLENGTAAVITFSSANSTALQQIDAGPANAVQLFYRAQLANTVVPTQQLISTSDGVYDSLSGVSSNQTLSPGGTGTAGGARTYTAAQDTATVEIDNIIINPGSKEFLDTSRLNAGLDLVPCVAAPCVDENVVVGEEVVVQLQFTVPVSQLTSFTLSDTLPAGMRCIEASDIVLPTFPGTDPGFTPGGTFIAGTCDDTTVSWDFGNQQLQGTGGGMQFEVSAQFIARIENDLTTNDGDIVRNGGVSTNAFVTYRDISNTLVNIPIAEARLTIEEPALAITKTIDPIAPATTVDGDDVMTVTVQVENTGNSPAYNLRLQDDMTAVGTNLTYVVGSEGGTDVPDTIDITTANAPVFGFAAPLDPGPGNAISFTFQIRAATLVAPLEQLDNTIAAAFTSLPNNTVALNAGGTIGTDGAIDGMRIGVLPAAGDPVNDYEATGTDFEAVPALTITKADLDGTVVPAIGARKSFQVVVNLPEGQADNVVVNDDLNAGVESFALENNATFDVTYAFQNITSINGSAVAGFTTPDDVEAALVSFTATDNATGSVNWNFGSVVTETEQDPAASAVNPQITITYFARVNNVVAVDAGDNLQNQADVDFRNGETGATANAVAPVVGPFVVVEPDLQVTKTGPATLLPATPGTFTITVENVGAATAWDVTITDIMPDLDPLPGGTCDTTPTNFNLSIEDITTAVRVVPVTDFTVNYQAAPACTLTVTLTPDTVNNIARLDAGDILTLTYDTQLDIGTPNGANLTNIAGATEWFSQDTDGVTVPAEVRTYTEVLSDGTTLILDHEDAHTVSTLGPIIGITKAVTQANAQPGDTLDYTIQVQNTGPVAAVVTVTDDVDGLNFPPGHFENNPTGTLNVVAIPGGAVDSSVISGGVNGSGFLDIGNISLPALTGSAIIQFQATLDDVIPNGTVVDNQASATLIGFNAITSNIAQTTISSAPSFTVEKTSADLTGDPNVLATGDRLQYTITVKNTGNENTINTLLNDQIPANTTYVANSTRLNGAAVADVGGASPLQNGLTINSPDVTTAGFLTADANIAANNVATITFIVTVNNNLVDGTVISNQALLTGQGQGGSAFTAQVSDDPNTPLVDDPTQNIVGNGVNIDSQKTVEVIPAGVVNAGVTLRYTITTFNGGNVVATGVNLIDDISAIPQLTYTPNSTTLDGIAVADVGGLSQLETANGGLPISSSDLTPPLPGVGNGQLSPGEAAVVVFDVTVNAVAAGTIISNQGMVSSNEQPDELTDDDGNDENGDMPTTVVVGGVPELSIEKEVQVVGGGTASVGDELEYVITVTNIGAVAADNIVVTDVMPASTTFVAGSAELNGSTVGTAFAAGTLTVDFSTSYGQLAPADHFIITFRVDIGALNPGDAISNTANLVWDDGLGGPVLNDSDTADIDVGGAPGVANLNGSVWQDNDHNDVFDNGETGLSGWQVDVFFNNATPTVADTPIASVLTDANGDYSLNGLAPGGPYTLAFSLPGNGVSFGQTAATVGTTGQMLITNINLSAGDNVQDEDLPAEPMGTVYNSITRQPVAGATVTLMQANGVTPVPQSCFTTPSHLANQQSQTTAANGFYLFELNYSNASCPAGGADYVIVVDVPNPGDDFFPGVSAIIPPEAGPLNPNTCVIDSVPPPPANTCEVQPQGEAPGATITAGPGTQYFLDLNLSAGPQNLFNNHVPLDPMLGGVITITKTTPLKNVVKGQLVPYTITLTNTLNVPLSGVEIRDNFPAGFKYVENSARVDGAEAEPTLNGLVLTWDNLSIRPLETLVLKLLLVVGSGVQEGEYVNTAQAFIAILNDPISGVASATVRVVPDPTFDCSDVIGKVYDDKNVNGYADPGELGLPGVRVVTARGLVVTTDEHGRFHIMCALVPNPDRGSNFILKVDERTLPSGYRITTENPRVQRLTRGKASKFNFGVAIHRVVRLDLADAAFVPGKTSIRPHWHNFLEDLMEQLQAGPSILRLSYLGDAETEKLVKRRVKTIRNLIEERWEDLSCCYNLSIEEEIFWRRGSPGNRGE